MGVEGALAEMGSVTELGGDTSAKVYSLRNLRRSEETKI
jgi:hypothetical protein